MRREEFNRILGYQDSDICCDSIIQCQNTGIRRFRRSKKCRVWSWTNWVEVFVERVEQYGEMQR